MHPSSFKRFENQPNIRRSRRTIEEGCPTGIFSGITLVGVLHLDLYVRLQGIPGGASA
jgi:hypothetical protein